MQFTCAILIVSSRQNCRGHIMHHHDTFHKMLPPLPLGTRINNTVPALKTTTVNRPVPALKKKARPGANKKYNRPVPALKKHNHPVPSRLEKKIQPPRPASEKKYNRPVPPRKKKQPPRPASGKKTDRPVPPRKKATTAPSRLEKKTTVPSRQEFPPLYFASPALPPKWKRWVNRQFSPRPVPLRF